MIRRWCQRRWQRAFATAVDTHLEQFRAAAAATGLPSGLLWKRVAPAGQTVFALDSNDVLTALVAIEVEFDAAEEGEMDDAPGLAMVRAATAVFRHDGRRWQVNPKAIFNLGPGDVLRQQPGWTLIDRDA